jgi:predicted glycoside hydrolase/deacetylase ChbG (UPF0249 family)
MIRIIVNADDFGYTDGICQGILDLLDGGYVTSTSVMAAAVGAGDRLARYRSDLLKGRAGVHLQLTGGIPLSSRLECPHLFAVGGEFQDPRKGVPPPVEEVEVEWRRQIEAVEKAVGERPTHLDTHHGMHRREEYFELYLKLAKELGVPVRGPLGAKVDEMKEAGVRGSTLLVRSWTGTGKGAQDLIALVRKVARESEQGDVIEVITHPGFVDEELRERSSMTDTREVELQALLEIGEGQMLSAAGSVLAEFRT